MNVGFSIPNKVDTELPQRLFDLRQYLNFVWRNWLFIVSVTAFVFLIGVIQLLRATPLYTATTEVLLQAEKSPAPTESGSSDYYRNRFFIHRKPVSNSQIRFSTAKGRYQGAARSPAARRETPGHR